MDLLVQINEDCTHSPEKEFIKDLNIAFACGDADYIKQHVTDDIEWDFKGSWSKKGQEVFDEIQRMKDSSVARLYLDCIIVYGNRASCNGIIYMENGVEYSFCDVFELKSAESTLVTKISSYIIDTSHKSA